MKKIKKKNTPTRSKIKLWEKETHSHGRRCYRLSARARRTGRSWLLKFLDPILCSLWCSVVLRFSVFYFDEPESRGFGFCVKLSYLTRMSSLSLSATLRRTGVDARGKFVLMTWRFTIGSSERPDDRWLGWLESCLASPLGAESSVGPYLAGAILLLSNITSKVDIFLNEILPNGT